MSQHVHPLLFLEMQEVLGISPYHMYEVEHRPNEELGRVNHNSIFKSPESYTAIDFYCCLALHDCIDVNSGLNCLF